MTANIALVLFDCLKSHKIPDLVLRATVGDHLLNGISTAERAETIR